MKKYIGTKVIMAEPMTMTEAQKVLGREFKPTTVEEDGYLVEYKNGYKSWSPKSVFEESYKCAETYVERLYIELEDVESRHKKLSTFLESKNFNNIKKEGMKFLLTLQSVIMTHYSCILSQRINNIFVGNLPGMSFGIAIEALKFGLPIKRKDWNEKGLFVVKQVPSHIEGDTIPKMQSLPQSAKDILMSRENPHIDYINQMLIVNSDGRADSWTPSVSDTFAEDWEVVIE